ncbi:MOSC domain-containing protein [Chachezhania sediminis]|uniref:MOSC domain-containing protein n=1 Tax=Chachezhania sediminis TaxID=2599291 RepID=UPI00131B9EE3|nr:MOSC domain-containing protein [Chachezhania sediminis]
MKGKIAALYHYPVKGLSPQQLDRVSLTPGEGFPHDRVFGFARHNSGLDPDNWRPLPKNRFLVLMTDAALAGLKTHYDPATGAFTIREGGVLKLETTLDTAEGADAAVDYMATYLDLPPGNRPSLARGGDNRFTDISVVSAQMMNAVSLINLASVRDFEKKTGNAVDPLRFRGNIYFDGWPPLAELGLVDREISLGNVRLRLCLRTRRCPATEVNPVTAERDMAVPKLLQQSYDHSDMGIYGEVIQGGTLTAGTEIAF